MVLVFMFKVVLPESRKKVYDGLEGSRQPSRESSSPCPTKRAADKWGSARFTGVFLASGFSCSQAFSQPAPPPLTQAVSPHVFS